MYVAGFLVRLTLPLPSLSICSSALRLGVLRSPHFRMTCSCSPDIFALLVVVALSISDVGREELFPVLAAALPPLVSSVSFGPVVFSFSGINRKQYGSVFQCLVQDSTSPCFDTGFVMFERENLGGVVAGFMVSLSVSASYLGTH
jgi:hypothetical protein